MIHNPSSRAYFYLAIFGGMCTKNRAYNDPNKQHTKDFRNIPYGQEWGHSR